jgi:small-conductance mechanosensitive channel
MKLARSKAEDPLLIDFLNKIFQIINIVLGVMLFLYIIGQSKIAVSLLGIGGVSAFILGFAFKDIGENFLAGIVMAFKRPFRIGDTIKSEGVEGSIVAMSLRDTHIKTFDGKDVYVPNGQIIKNPLYNYTIDGFLRHEVVLGVDYSTDLNKTRKTILEVVQSVPGVLNETKVPNVYIKNLGPSAIELGIQFWVDTFDKKTSTIEIKNQVYTRTLNKLEAENVIMPGNIVELKNYSSESLSLSGDTLKNIV